MGAACYPSDGSRRASRRPGRPDNRAHAPARFRSPSPCPRLAGTRLRDLALPHLERAACAPARPTAAPRRRRIQPRRRRTNARWPRPGAGRARDGALPFAAQAAQADGIDVGDAAPGACSRRSHWQLGRDQVTLADPQALELDEAESRALVRRGARVCSRAKASRCAWGAPLRWYVAHDSLAGLPCASLDRVIGRNVDRWLPEAHRGRLLRRLQSEVQMLLLPAPPQRGARGSGAADRELLLAERLRPRPAAPRRRAVQVDVGAARAAAVRRLGRLGRGLAQRWTRPAARSCSSAAGAASRWRSTLCGERLAQRYEPASLTLAGSADRALQAPSAQAVLEAL